MLKWGDVHESGSATVEPEAAAEGRFAAHCAHGCNGRRNRCPRRIETAQISRTGLRQIRKWLDDYGLSVAAVSFRTRRGYDVLQDLQPRIDATKDALRFAHDLGCPVVVNQVGRVTKSDPASIAWDTLLGSLSELGRFSQQVGAWLAMETGTESGGEMAQLLQALPEGSVMVDLNPGNLVINGFSPLEAVQTLGPHIIHVHARDAVRDLAQGRGLEVPLGRGSADFPALLAALEQHSYRGYFTVACQDSRHPAEDWRSPCSFSRTSCRGAPYVLSTRRAARAMAAVSVRRIRAEVDRRPADVLGQLLFGVAQAAFWTDDDTDLQRRRHRPRRQ